MTKYLQGPSFPSYHQPARVGKQVRVWIHHTGRRQAIRNLRSKCVHVLNSRDPNDLAALDRCRKAVEGEPEPEYALYHLVANAWDAHEGTGCPWHEAMTYLLDKFDDAKEDEATAQRQALEILGVAPHAES